MDPAISGSPADLADVIERFDHVSMAVAGIEGVLPLVEAIGGTFYQGADHPRNEFRWVQFWVPGGGKLEFIAPLTETSFLRRDLDRRGEGFHHVTFKVRSLERATARAAELGYRITGLHWHEAWSEAFLPPKTTHGMLIQLAEWTDPFPVEGPLEAVLAGRVIDPT